MDRSGGGPADEEGGTLPAAAGRDPRGRSTARRRLPPRFRRGAGRLHRRRRLLRPLRLSDLRSAAGRGRRHRPDPGRKVLRQACAPAAAGRGGRRPVLRGDGPVHLLADRLPAPAAARDRRRAVCRELGRGGCRQRLLLDRHPDEPLGPLLVARRGGAVLHRLAGPRRARHRARSPPPPPGGPGPPGGLRCRHRRQCRRRAPAPRVAVHLLRHAHPRLRAVRRRDAGSPDAPAEPGW